MKVDVYNIKAEKIDQIELSDSVFGLPANPTLIAQAIRVYRSNQRSAFAKTKHRGDVAGTTKKVWAQKGTGRARHGSRKAPIFVGGGSAHGPKGNQNYTLKLSAKMRQSAIKSVLSQFAHEKSLLAITDFNTISPKTKVGWALFDIIEKDNKLLANSRKIGIITAANSNNIKRAFGNIPDINLLSLDSLNVYDLANQKFLVFSTDALEKINKNG